MSRSPSKTRVTEGGEASIPLTRGFLVPPRVCVPPQHVERGAREAVRCGKLLQAGERSGLDGKLGMNGKNEMSS